MINTIRCFIAIELTQEIKNAFALIQNELKQSAPNAKWVNPENIHITLKFLGNITPQTVEEIKQILHTVSSKYSPFKISLGSLGAFPSLERPRVLWVGLKDGGEESKKLADMIEEETSKFGIQKEERVFHPHLTFARIEFLKDKSALKNAFASLKIPSLSMPALKITLFQSTLTPKGPIYASLHEVNFKQHDYNVRI